MLNAVNYLVQPQENLNDAQGAAEPVKDNGLFAKIMAEQKNKDIKQEEKNLKQENKLAENKLVDELENKSVVKPGDQRVNKLADKQESKLVSKQVNKNLQQLNSLIKKEEQNLKDIEVLKQEISVKAKLTDDELNQEKAEKLSNSNIPLDFILSSKKVLNESEAKTKETSNNSKAEKNFEVQADKLLNSTLDISKESSPKIPNKLFSNILSSNEAKTKKDLFKNLNNKKVQKDESVKNIKQSTDDFLTIKHSLKNPTTVSEIEQPLALTDKKDLNLEKEEIVDLKNLTAKKKSNPNHILFENKSNLTLEEVPETVRMDFAKITDNNVDSVISKITDYINQSKFTNSPKLSINFNHEVLGNINIHVEDLDKQNNLELNISTQSDKGFNFFNGHKNSLIASLEKAGLNISGIKVENSQDLAMSLNQSSNQQLLDEGSNWRQDSQGRERRQELWDDYRERMVA